MEPQAEDYFSNPNNSYQDYPYKPTVITYKTDPPPAANNYTAPGAYGFGRKGGGAGSEFSDNSSYPISRIPPKSKFKTGMAALAPDTRTPEMQFFSGPNFKRYHVPGYAGHVQCERFDFGRSFGRVTRDVMAYNQGNTRQYKGFF
jgi:hypothetical protein